VLAAGTWYDPGAGCQQIETTVKPLVSTSATADAAKAIPAKSDFDTIQGTWKGVEVGGSEDTAVLTIAGHDLECRGANPNDWYKGTFTLREDSTPRQCVLAITGCPLPDYVGKTCLAIYQIADGTLTMAGNEPGNPNAPAAFGAEGSRTFKFKLK
jgi:uncharacterized protein (TIGR03067 family)